MGKHAHIETPDQVSTQAQGFMPRHRADSHVTETGADQLNPATVVQVFSQFGDDWGPAQIISHCDCGCDQYAIGPVGWYESETTTSLDALTARNLEARVTDTGVNTSEGVPVVKMMGVYPIDGL
jgi:hypothetical protein